MQNPAIHEQSRGPVRLRQFVERHINEGWTEAALRWLVFQAKANGLEESGAILRVGRRIFIDEALFYAWLRGQRQSA
jgi:hypothetical protein